MSNLILNNNINNNNYHNDNINNSNSNNSSNSNSSTKTNGTQACAACKYQRRKCAPDCLLAPYFPHHLHHQFLNAHRLFGVSNITKIIKPLPQPQKDQAMRTIKFESDVRASDPVGGSYRIICNLQAQVELACAEHELVLQQLAICRAAADTVSLLCDQEPQTQPQVAGAESEVVINNGVDEAISHPQSQTEDDGNYNMVNKNPSPEDQIYQHDLRHLDVGNDKEDVGIEEYFLEEDNVVHDDENNNQVSSFQDIKAPWAMQDAFVYCLNDREGFISECEDLNPRVADNVAKRPRLKYSDDEPHLPEHSDEAILKDSKAIVQEENPTCIFKDEKSISREDCVTIEDAENHDLTSAATMYTTA